MKNFIVVIGLILLCTSCFVHKGQLVNGQCRPKHPNFKLLKIPFKETSKLAFNRVYTLNGQYKIGVGFYNDGRMILISNHNYKLQNYELITNVFLEGKNWNISETIGYWRVDGVQIEIEYFSCSNSGCYIRDNGKIKGDTLIFEQDCGTPNPFKSVKCPEKYVLSDLSFD